MFYYSDEVSPALFVVCSRSTWYHNYQHLSHLSSLLHPCQLIIYQTRDMIHLKSSYFTETFHSRFTELDLFYLFFFVVSYFLYSYHYSTFSFDGIFKSCFSSFWVVCYDWSQENNSLSFILKTVFSLRIRLFFFPSTRL